MVLGLRGDDLDHVPWRSPPSTTRWERSQIHKLAERHLGSSAKRLHMAGHFSLVRLRLWSCGALITGASSGIGAATARAMSRRRAQVLLVARSKDKLEALVRELGGGAAAYPCDAGDHRAVAVMAKRVQAEHGVPDAVVNNAGAGRWLSIEDTDPEEFLEMAAVPYFAAFFITRAFIEGMLARGSGWVVNVNSPASQIPWPGAVGYTSARWAMRGFDAGLRADLRQSGIGVTHLVPARSPVSTGCTTLGLKSRYRPSRVLSRPGSPSRWLRLSAGQWNANAVRWSCR
jgi:short-subunit dehydrogenase